MKAVSWSLFLFYIVTYKKKVAQVGLPFFVKLKSPVVDYPKKAEYIQTNFSCSRM